MAKPTSPFDDPTDDAPVHPALAPRPRRPWWRWNILTLFAVLFVLVWVRHLLSLGPSATWTTVLMVAMAWGVSPLFFVSSVLTTMGLPPDKRDAEAEGGSMSGWRRRNWLLVLLCAMAQVLVFLSVAHLVIYLGWFVISWASVSFNGYGPYRRWEQLLVMFYMPLLEVFFSGALYALTLIAMRLDPLNREQ